MSKSNRNSIDIFWRYYSDLLNYIQEAYYNDDTFSLCWEKGFDSQWKNTYVQSLRGLLRSHIGELASWVVNVEEREYVWCVNISVRINKCAEGRTDSIHLPKVASSMKDMDAIKEEDSRRMWDKLLDVHMTNHGGYERSQEDQDKDIDDLIHVLRNWTPSSKFNNEKYKAFDEGVRSLIEIALKESDTERYPYKCKCCQCGFYYSFPYPLKNKDYCSLICQDRDEERKKNEHTNNQEKAETET